MNNPNIKRLEDGLHHIQWEGQWSGYGATTHAKAEAYLSKLARGLVVFEPIKIKKHRPEFKPGFANGATSRNRITTTN